jgi:hypothetical protein
MAPVVDLQLYPQVPHAISNGGSIPDLLTALKRKKSISFAQNSTKFHPFVMHIFQRFQRLESAVYCGS